MNVINAADHGWRVLKEEPARVKEGVGKLRDALEAAYIERRNRPSGLPKDWRNRIFDNSNNQ